MIIGLLFTGSLPIAYGEMRTNYIVRFNYLSNQEDMDRCVNGTHKKGDILKAV